MASKLSILDDEKRLATLALRRAEDGMRYSVDEADGGYIAAKMETRCNDGHVLSTYNSDGLADRVLVEFKGKATLNEIKKFVAWVEAILADV